MKKYFLFIIIAFVLVVGGLLFYFMNKNNTPSTNYNYARTEYNISLNTNTSSNTSSNTFTNNTQSSKPATFTEEQIASYSTKIQNKRDSNRQQNISITCSALNGTEVKAGNTFSFCDTVGESTAERGYKEANVIIQGVEQKGLGGGNCQISSTLYNAVLASPVLEVVERHPHSAEVPYIERGKDAAISYGSHDFKFKNNSGSTIKVYASNTPDEISIRIVKLVQEYI